MSDDEQQHTREARYKIEYPFHAIDATLFIFLRGIGRIQGAVGFERNQITSGSVEYRIHYKDFTITFVLLALDTHLCLLQLNVPHDYNDIELRSLLDGIVKAHEQTIVYAKEAESLFAADRAQGGNTVWPEDAEAIARLREHHDRAKVKEDWLKHVIANRKRKKIADLDNRFRQLVHKANKK